MGCFRIIKNNLALPLPFYLDTEIKISDRRNPIRVIIPGREGTELIQSVWIRKGSESMQCTKNRGIVRLETTTEID